MLEHVRRLFHGLETDAVAAPEPVRERVAAAALLVEAARMDGELKGAERARIEALLRERFALDEEDARELLEAAETASAESTDWHGFTRELKEELDEAERIRLIEMLWEVVYTDGVLHDMEASLMRRVGGLLYVSQRDWGDARRRVMQRLGIG